MNATAHCTLGVVEGYCLAVDRAAGCNPGGGGMWMQYSNGGWAAGSATSRENCCGISPRCVAPGVWSLVWRPGVRSRAGLLGSSTYLYVRR
jgi:hypothetical protein